MVLKHFLVCLALMSIIGVVIDFGFAGMWGLSPQTLALAWVSVLMVYAVSYWLASLLIKVLSSR